MLTLRGFGDVAAARGGLLSIGNFDGVHRGHQAILQELVRQARRLSVPAVAVTFDPHPIALLAPDRLPPALTTLERKAELLAACGVDALLVVDTRLELLRLTAEEFFEQIVVQTLDARGLVEGPNFYFGHDRGGDVRLLDRLCRASGRTLTVVAPVAVAGRTVSSSAIRLAISSGRMADAIAMLGHPHRVIGHVIPGAGRGGTLGFPTANLTGVTTLLPPNGVYAGLAYVADDASPPTTISTGGPTGSPLPHPAAAATAARPAFPAAVHLGPNPTFGETGQKLEVHLVGFQGDLYGRRLCVDLLDRLRDTCTFADRTALEQQLRRDVDAAVACGERWLAGGNVGFL